MANKRATVYLRGYIYWAKIFGSPRTNYNEDGREWGFEFEPDEDGVSILNDHGLSDRLKTKFNKKGEIRKGYDDREPYLSLKRPEFDYEGEVNEHIRVVDAANQAWPDKTNIGNKSEVDVKVSIVDYGVGKFKGIYPIAVRVLDLVPFESNEFAPLADDDPRVKAVKKAVRTDDFNKDFGMEEESDAGEDKPAEKASRNKKSPVPEGELDDDMPV